MKYFLAIETSRDQGSIGLFCINNKTLKPVVLKKWQAQSYKKNKIRHSHKLPLEIKEMLAEANLNLKDLDFFALGIGPGRFTGVRTALNIIKTLAFCFKKPCYPVDSLEVTAEPFLAPKQNFCVAVNAFNNSVYFADFKDGKISSSSQVLSFPDTLDYIQKNKKTLCLGDLHLFYEIDSSLQKICSFQVANPQVEHLAEIVFNRFNPQNLKPWFDLKPLYLRSAGRSKQS